MASNEEKRYSIGQMAKLCNVTTKQLRHYDENNILSPCYKDEETNYRYYSESQLEEILLIKELKRIGLSLKDIASLLNRRDLPALKAELEESLHRAKDELHAARQKYDQTIEVFLRVINAIDLVERPESTENGGHDFKLVDVPLRRVIYTRHQGYWNAKTLFIVRRAELYRIVDEYNLTTSGPNMAIFHGDYLKQFSDKPEDGEGDLEVCISITESRECCPYCRNLGGFQAVSAIHVGHYRYLEPVYQDLKKWAEQQGYELENCSIEEYISGATMTNKEENYVTRIYIPLKGSIV